MARLHHGPYVAISASHSWVHDFIETSPAPRQLLYLLLSLRMIECYCIRVPFYFPTTNTEYNMKYEA